MRLNSTNRSQDYTELLDGQKEPAGNRDILVHKLKLRIQERDRALEVYACAQTYRLKTVFCESG